MQECFVDLQLSLIPDGQSAIIVQPGQCPLDYPTMPSQFLAAFNSTSRNPRGYSSRSQCFPTLPVVVPFVGVQLHRSLSPTAASSAKPRFFLCRLDGVHYFHKHVAVMNISTRTHYRKRDPSSVDHNMALRTRFASIRWRRAGSLAPFLAGTLAESTEALVQSILPASPSLSRSSWCRRSHTPASCQSRRRRQQVIPLPQPISGGNISHGRPVLSTKMIPVRAARLGTLGRPPFGLEGSRGNSGSMTSQSSSLTNAFAIPYFTGSGRF
jgi:hypothetical protein